MYDFESLIRRHISSESVQNKLNLHNRTQCEAHARIITDYYRKHRLTSWIFYDIHDVYEETYLLPFDIMHAMLGCRVLRKIWFLSHSHSEIFVLILNLLCNLNMRVTHHHAFALLQRARDAAVAIESGTQRVYLIPMSSVGDDVDGFKYV